MKISVHCRVSFMFSSLMSKYSTNVFCLYSLYTEIKLFSRFYNFLSDSLNNEMCVK